MAIPVPTGIRLKAEGRTRNRFGHHLAVKPRSTPILTMLIWNIVTMAIVFTAFVVPLALVIVRQPLPDQCGVQGSSAAPVAAQLDTLADIASR